MLKLFIGIELMLRLSRILEGKRMMFLLKLLVLETPLLTWIVLKLTLFWMVTRCILPQTMKPELLVKGSYDFSTSSFPLSFHLFSICFTLYLTTFLQTMIKSLYASPRVILLLLKIRKLRLALMTTLFSLMNCIKYIWLMILTHMILMS